MRSYQGRARSDHLDPGVYTLRAWSADVPHTTREVVVRGGETAHLRIDLPSCVRRTIVFVKPEDQPEAEIVITWYDSDGNVLSDDTSTRIANGLPAGWPLAFTPGTYRVVAIDRERGLRGEQSFRIGPDDPPEGRVEVVLR